MSISKKIALSATTALVIGSSSLYAESNTTIPQIPNEINVSIINNNTGSTVSALPPSIQLNAVDTTVGVNKNKKLGLHLNSVNMATVTLQSDSSVTLIQETDFLYAKFAKSGTHTITAIGKAIDGSDINASVTFDVINRTPITNNSTLATSKVFSINANEILKFDAYTYFLDEDDENLTFNKVSLPTQGSLEINSNRVTYYPTSTTAGYSATFDVNGTDIEGSSTNAIFTVNVSADSEKINLINGWNLLGNSAQEGMNVSDINISGESIWAYIDGLWSQSMISIKPKQGFWLKTISQRVLEVKPNGDTTDFNTSAPFGWRLLADNEAKTLKRLKFGNDAVWTYKDNTWFNANNYPDYEVSRYSGFWTQGVSVGTPVTTTETNTTTVVDSNISLVNESNSSLVGVNAALFELENNLNVTGTNLITLAQTAGIASYETVSPIVGVASYKSDGVNGLSVNAVNFSQSVSYSAKYNLSNTTDGTTYFLFAFLNTGFVYFEHLLNNTYVLRVYNNSTTAEILYGNLDANLTYTIGFTRDASTGVLIGYLNGVEIGRVTHGITTSTNHDTIGINGSLIQPIPAGSLIDSIRLEQRVWTPAEMLLTH